MKTTHEADDPTAVERTSTNEGYEERIQDARTATPEISDDDDERDALAIDIPITREAEIRELLRSIIRANAQARPAPNGFSSVTSEAELRNTLDRQREDIRTLARTLGVEY